MACPDVRGRPFFELVDCRAYVGDDTDNFITDSFKARIAEVGEERSGDGVGVFFAELDQTGELITTVGNRAASGWIVLFTLGWFAIFFVAVLHKSAMLFCIYT